MVNSFSDCNYMIRNFGNVDIKNNILYFYVFSYKTDTYFSMFGWKLICGRNLLSIAWSVCVILFMVYTIRQEITWLVRSDVISILNGISVTDFIRCVHQITKNHTQMHTNLFTGCANNLNYSIFWVSIRTISMHLEFLLLYQFFSAILQFVIWRAKQ